MVVQVQQSGDTFSFKLPPQAAEELALVDGASLEIRRPAETARPALRYASVDEVMKVHREMEPNHADAYSELAK